MQTRGLGGTVETVTPNRGAPARGVLGKPPAQRGATVEALGNLRRKRQPTARKLGSVAAPGGPV